MQMLLACIRLAFSDTFMNLLCIAHHLTSSPPAGFFLSSSHLRNLQIWWPVLRLRQLLHCSQFILRRQGGHRPHRFRFFFPLALRADEISLCVCWCSDAPVTWESAPSARNTPAGVIMNSPGWYGKLPPTPPLPSNGKSITLPSESEAETVSMSPPKLTLDGSLTGSSIPARRRSSAAWARCRPLGESRRPDINAPRSSLAYPTCDLCWLAVVWALTPAATIELWASLLALATLATAAAEQVAMYCERALERFRLLLSGALMMPLRFLRSNTGDESSSPQQLSCASSSSTARLPSMDPPLADMGHGVRGRERELRELQMNRG